MNFTRDRIRSLGWAVVLTICACLTVALVLRVNAVKGTVHQTERKIVAVKQDIHFLRTEFETRANQQQLRMLNDVEFGYSAPRAEQYIEGERHLANLGKPRPLGSPEPLRVASAAAGDAGDAGEEAPPLAMLSPVTGLAADKVAAKPEAVVAAPAKAAPAPASARAAPATAGDDLVAQAIQSSGVGDRLSRIDRGRQ